MVQNSIFKFVEIFIFSEFFPFSDSFIFRDTFIFRDIFILKYIFIFRTFLYSETFLYSKTFLYSESFLCSETFLYSVKSLYARKIFLKMAVSKMLRSFSVEQPCWSPFEVHLQAFLRAFLQLHLEKGTPQQTLFPEFFKILEKLATLKVAVCRPVIYCKGTQIQSSSWTPTEIFETSLRNLVGSLCCNPQTVNL